MSALFLCVLRPPLHGLRRFSPPPRYSAELKQTKPLSPRFATSLPYRRRLCRSSSKTFPRFWQLYGFPISILGSPPPGRAPEADPPTPPLGLPPGGSPRGLPFVSYIMSCRIVYRGGGWEKISLIGYSIRSHTVGSVRMRVQGRFVCVYRVGSCAGSVRT